MRAKDICGHGLAMLLVLLCSCTRDHPYRNAEQVAIQNVRKIAAAEEIYLTMEGKYGDLPKLQSAGLLDHDFAEPVYGYLFDVRVRHLEYTIIATPTSSQSGRFGYIYKVPDGVIRYSTEPSLAPAHEAGKPVY
jgi:hypothetical protein